jgi:hypothetical protein
MMCAATTPDTTARPLPRPVFAALRRLLALVHRAPAEIMALSKVRSGTDVGHADALAQIAAWLYRDWYTALPRTELPIQLVPGREDLTTALRASVAGASRWEPGWVVMQTNATGVCVAGTKQMQRTLLPGEYVNLARPGVPVAPGDQVAVPQVLTWRDDATGFWCAQSHAREPTAPLVRIYFDVRPENVGFVLQSATTALDDLNICYTLKCPAFAAAYQRVDTLIFYLETSAWHRAHRAVTSLAPMHQSHLRNAVPPLTRPLAAGIAFAEHPASGGSFGETRCNALAPAILSLILDGSQDAAWDLSRGVALLAAALSAAGIDPSRPWLTGATAHPAPAAPSSVP